MKIESPVKKFPGYVILPDFLTIPQVKAITDALGDPPSERPEGSVIAEEVALRWKCSPRHAQNRLCELASGAHPIFRAIQYRCPESKRPRTCYVPVEAS